MEELHAFAEKASGRLPIRLTRGLVAMVEGDDFDDLNRFKWYALKAKHTFYAVRNAYRPGGRGEKKFEYMHRIVLERKLGRPLASREQADHINGDGLDNCRANLRAVTHAQNNRNKHRRIANTSSRFLGVSWHRGGRKWVAQVGNNNKPVYLGLYATELDAALAREKFIAAHPELMARPNFQIRRRR